MGHSGITVILPTRDRPEWLRAAARAVLAQSLPPEELVVVEDGEPRSAEAALQGLAERTSVRVGIVAGPRRGPAAARNAGLGAARGELVAFLDDDDLWVPEKLAWQARWLTAYPRLGLLGTACVRTVTPEAGGWRSRGRALPPSRVSRSALLRANRLTTSSVVARRECFRECGGFDESLPLAQDWDMWLRIAARWAVGVVPAALTVYRVHSEQRSREAAAMRRWEVEVVRRALARGTPGRWVRGVGRRRMSWAYCRLGRLLLRRGDADGAFREFRRALALHPLHPLIWSGLARCAVSQQLAAGAFRP